MNIAIVGAGNLGTTLACDLSRKNHVRILTSKPEEFSTSLVYYDSDSNNSWNASIDLASNNYSEVITNADIVFFTLPTFLIRDAVKKSIPYLKEESMLGFVPGAGGVEYLASEALKAGFTIFGFERVPFVARLVQYGHSVIASKKSKYRVASIPTKKAQEVSRIIENLFERPCSAMSEFISMTLTPSLHTSRLYDLYRDYHIGQELDENPFFYREWRDSASYLTFEMDAELHLVCDELTKNGISAKEVVPYPVHYESPTPELLTKKLQSIQSLTNIKGPLIEITNGRYILDINSRYFTESYPYRLCIVKGLADLLGIDIPRTDEVISWYSKLAAKEYIINRKLVGRDVFECNIPQNYGINSIEQLRTFYK